MSERIFNQSRNREQRVIRIPDAFIDAYNLVWQNSIVFIPFLARQVNARIGGEFLSILDNHMMFGRRAFLTVPVENREIYIEEDLVGDLGFRADTSNRYDAQLKIVMDALHTELFALMTILNTLTPDVLHDLRSATRNDIFRALFGEIVNLGRTYSWRELSEEDNDEIQELISSPNKSLREIGLTRVREVRAKMGLQIVYQNQYGNFIKNFRHYLETDIYAGPRGFQCAII